MLTGLLTSEDRAKVAIRVCVSRVPMVRCSTVDDLLSVKWKNKHATGAIGTNVGYTVEVDEPLIRQIHAIIIFQNFAVSVWNESYAAITRSSNDIVFFGRVKMSTSPPILCTIEARGVATGGGGTGVPFTPPLFKP